MKVGGVSWRTVELGRDGRLVLIDQKQIPFAFATVETVDWRDTARCIVDMTVRGAGAIGATGAAGVAQAAITAPDEGFFAAVDVAVAGLRATRPTAQNLFAGIERVRRAMDGASSPAEARERAFFEARAVADDDASACKAIGEHGRALIRDGMRISTHCNAGWLAFVDWGSALSPIYAAHRDGLRLHVWVDETRPRQQGARLTAWELGQEGVPHAIVTDGVIGSIMKRGEVDLVIVGSDRIAANGDVANKVGTYALAVLAKHHGVPFYVAAPSATIDWACPNGDAIPIEERSTDEVHLVHGPDAQGALHTVRVTAPGAGARNPAFDVTPAALITGIITERGVFAPGGLQPRL